MDAAEAKLVRLCGWSGIAFVVLFALGWGLLGRNIPPYSAAMPADELAGIYRANASTMRIGFALGAFSCLGLITWAIGIFRIMVQMEGAGSKVLPYAQLVGGVLTGMVPLFASIFWLTAAFRPEQDASIIRLLFDIGWLMIDLGFCVTLLQYCAIAGVALRDTRTPRLFPKWLAWLGVWTSLEFLLELMMPYFRTGPFAWYGLFNYWVPFFLPFVYIIAISYYMIKAATRLNEEFESSNAKPLSGSAAV
jgi:hypothetical protein